MQDKRLRYALTVATAIIAFVVFSGLSQRITPVYTVSAATPAPDMTTVQRGDLLLTLSVSGALQAKQTAALSFTATGKVATIAVEQGDHVLKGQVIATLENASALNAVLLAQAKINTLQVILHRLTDAPRQADLNVFKMALNLAQAQLKAAQSSVDRTNAQIAQLGVENAKNAQWMQELTRDADKKKKDDLAANPSTVGQANAMPSNEAENAALTQKNFDVDVAQANLEAAQSKTGNLGTITAAQAQIVAAQNALDKLMEGGDKQDIERTKINLEAAQVALEQAKATVNKSKLIAPFDGVIGKLNLHVGEPAPTTGPAAVLLDTSGFVVDLPIDEVNLAHISVGQDADITFVALPGVTLKGHVTRIAPSGQRTGNIVTYIVRVELDSTDQPLLSSMTAAVNIITGKATNALLVANRFIRADSATGKAYVNVQQPDGSFKPVEVVLGLQNETVTEIKSGVQADDVLALP